MPEKVQHEWRLEVAKSGTMCKVYCDGTQLMNVQGADLHLSVGKPTTLHLTHCQYGPPTKPFVENPVFRRGDAVIVNGAPAHITEEYLDKITDVPPYK
jgi:hypothetical protein